MTNLGAERRAVQNPLIQYATQIGWEYIPRDEALNLRGGETRLIFRAIFTDRMQKLNPGFLDSLLIDEIIKRLERIPPNIKGNLTAWEYLKGIKTIFVPDEKRERNIQFLDTQNINNNTFHVTDEFSFISETKPIRPDVIFLINGVPVFIIETKAAYKTEGIAEALDQIRRYHRQAPEFLALLQVYTLTHILQFYYSATWNLSRKGLFNWKDEVEGNFEDLVKSFLDKERVVKVLTDYILFTMADDELSKVILRPHQMRATSKILDRAAVPQMKKGLIWHTQGSGKTYTMIVSAQKIMDDPVFSNPTVIILVDRNELESQLFTNLESAGIKSIEVAQSKRHLQQLLKDDNRGLIVSMIHKFDGMPGNINTRDNVFVLVDEAHRTTGGKLGNYLMGALPNATYIGFTGTPIDRTASGQSIFITFGIEDPPHGYLDKYSISESIYDGTTVQLHYSLAPNDLRVDRETLEKEFLDLREAEGVSDVEELNKVLEKAVNLRNMLKNRQRMEKIAQYVANHFNNYIEPMGYKAFLVAVDREACAMYKEELDKHLPLEYSSVVISPAQNDSEHLEKYHISKEEEKSIRKAFRKPDEFPKILIVTEKLLTGFDAPILYCMYLDKPMRDHVLLQAIARVNRPYEDEKGRKKHSGLVLDFVGIFEKLEKALAFDSMDIEGIVHDLEVLKDCFIELIEEAKAQYLVLLKGRTGDKEVEAILEYFRDEEQRHKYYQFFREISDIYEILSPDAFLRPYIQDYENLARMYRILKDAFEPGISPDREFSRKTARLVQEHTKSGALKASLDVFEIDENTLHKIEESNASDTEKVFNLLKSIRKEVEDKSGKSPYLISIGEKAQRIAEQYIQRQTDTEQALEELKSEINDINTARRDEAEKQFPAEVFTIYWILKKENVEYAEEKAARMTNVLERFPYWKTSDQHKREVQRELYKVLVFREERKRVGDWLKTEKSIENHEPLKLNLQFFTVIVSKIMAALKR